MKYLFPNFLNDLNELIESQLHWIRLCQEILEKNQQQDNWAVGADPPQHDLSGFGSYGIIGGFNFEKTKGFDINQQDPKDRNWEMVAYTSESDKFSDTKPVIYLHFNCNLSEESSNIFSKLLEKWIQPDTSREDIESFINSLDLMNKPIEQDTNKSNYEHIE